MTETITDQLLRHKREAEWLFAACAINSTNDARQLCGWLQAEQFHDVDLRRFWAAILGGEDGTKAAIDAGILFKIGGYLTREILHSWDITHYAAAIAEDIYLVEIAERAGQMMSLVSQRKSGEVRELVGEMGGLSSTGRLDIPDAADAGIAFLSTLDDKPDVIYSGIPDLDHKFGGFNKRNLVLVAARPSMGKTALALQIARTAAAAHKKVIYFSLEMAAESLWSRLACGDAGIDSRKYKTRSLSEHDRQSLVDTTNSIIGEIGDYLFIDDRSSLTTEDIWRACAQLRPDVIVVDHLSLVKEDADNEVLRLGKVSWGGKQIAKEFNLCAIYPMQLSRDVENRANKRPTLSDLRGSGELEQNADVVMFIHRPDYYNNNGQEIGVSPTELLIGKDREGARNVMVKAQYNLIQQKFYGETKRELP